MKKIEKTINTNGTLMLTDPCYSSFAEDTDPSGCGAKAKVKPGTYTCYYGDEMEDCRIDSIMVLHESVTVDADRVLNGNKYDVIEQPGGLAVDSGQMSISDVEWYEDYREGDEGVFDRKYDEICDVTCGFVKNPNYTDIRTTDFYLDQVMDARKIITDTLEKYKVRAEMKLWNEVVKAGLFCRDDFLLDAFLFSIGRTLKCTNNDILTVYAQMVEENDRDLNGTGYETRGPLAKEEAAYLARAARAVREALKPVKNAIAMEIHNNMDKYLEQYETQMANVYDDAALVSATGWGDGYYPYSLIVNKDGETVGVLIQFIGEDEDEDEDDYYEDDDDYGNEGDWDEENE